MTANDSGPTFMVFARPYRSGGDDALMTVPGRLSQPRGVQERILRHQGDRLAQPRERQLAHVAAVEARSARPIVPPTCEADPCARLPEPAKPDEAV